MDVLDDVARLSPAELQRLMLDSNSLYWTYYRYESGGPLERVDQIEGTSEEINRFLRAAEQNLKPTEVEIAELEERERQQLAPSEMARRYGSTPDIRRRLRAVDVEVARTARKEHARAELASVFRRYRQHLQVDQTYMRRQLELGGGRMVQRLESLDGDPKWSSVCEMLHLLDLCLVAQPGGWSVGPGRVDMLARRTPIPLIRLWSDPVVDRATR